MTHPLTTLKKPPPTWQSILRNNFTSLKAIAAFLELDELQKNELDWKPNFILNLPLRLANKMAKKTLNDPIARQFLPLACERIVCEGFVADPVQDCSFQVEKKLLKKYSGRALLMCTSACAMHCRYCFRREYPYETEQKGFAQELKAIEQDTSIQEVILSGGDPLSLTDAVLKDLLLALEAIPHVARIRFHTRFPLGIPERIDENFLEMLSVVSKQLIFVIHCNHSRELDDEVLFRLKLLQKQGCLLLNQSVLLKHVNDDLLTLTALSQTLVNHGILPYYLHQIDRAAGTAHFEVTEERGRELIQRMTEQLSGFAVPKYARETPGELHKTTLFPMPLPLPRPIPMPMPMPMPMPLPLPD